jgi:membrane protein
MVRLRFRSPDNSNPMPTPSDRNILKRTLHILKTTFSEWNKHNATRLGASLAFYALISVAPLTLIIIPISTLVFGRAEVERAVVRYADKAAGPAMGDALQELVGKRRKQSSGLPSAVLTFGTLLFAASAVFRELRSAMNVIYEVEPKKSTLKSAIKQYLFAMVIVLVLGVLILASLVFRAILTGIHQTMPAGISVPGKGLEWIDFFATFIVITVVIALIFRFMPGIVIAWRPIWVGAVATAFLVTIGKSLLGTYIGTAGVASRYGAAGSLVALALWVYYSAQIFFLGAEFTRVYAGAQEGILRYRHGFEEAGEK